MKISEEKEEAIRTEEKVRRQVYAEIAQERSPIARKLGWIYDFLDCRPGLFLASIVVVPGILWLHSSWTEGQRAASEREAYRQKLLYEVEARIRQHQGRLASGDVIGFIESTNVDYVYPRLSGYKMETLFVEMSRLNVENADAWLKRYRGARDSLDEASMSSLFRKAGWLE